MKKLSEPCVEQTFTPQTVVQVIISHSSQFVNLYIDFIFEKSNFYIQFTAPVKLARGAVY